VIGVHLVGDRVGELISEGQLAVAWEAHPKTSRPTCTRTRRRARRSARRSSPSRASLCTHSDPPFPPVRHVTAWPREGH
jgi:hypothetical protein